MNQVLEHLQAELQVEEGERSSIYDDATGKPFIKGDTLKGNLSVGMGLNLSIPFAPQELAFIESFRIQKGMALLCEYPWFAEQDPVRQTALADIAYNIGTSGLLHWPHFLAYMAKKQYPSAVAEIRGDTLWVNQVGPLRSGRLEAMLLSGEWPPDIKVQGA